MGCIRKDDGGHFISEMVMSYHSKRGAWRRQPSFRTLDCVDMLPLTGVEMVSVPCVYVPTYMYTLFPLYFRQPHIRCGLLLRSDSNRAVA